MKTTPIRLAIIGLGTVGGGVVDLLNKNLDEMKRRTGRDIVITYVGTRRHRPELDPAIQQSADLLDIVKQKDVDIVVEVMGGTTVAKDVILTAIEYGKDVVTANKALLAEHGNEIFAKADANNVKVLYEAAVAGGIPIIKTIREALAANKIDWLAGIINGTGNFIMTEMKEKGRTFEDVLKEAQALGYAEADPTFDVEGIDAAHKLTLLASIAFGIPLQFDKVYCEGITKISLQDVKYADELGYRIKHLGFAVRRELDNDKECIELRVHPTMIPADKLLANVNGVKNAVLIDAIPVGQTLYYGAGAGGGATASAVMADVMDMIRSLTQETDEINHTVPHLAFLPNQLDNIQILPSDEMITGYYLRVQVKDDVGVLAQLTQILSQSQISIAAILQKPAFEQGEVPIIIMVDPVMERNMNEAIAKIEALDSVIDKVVRIRVDELAE